MDFGSQHHSTSKMTGTEFVTLAVCNQLLEMQEKSFRTLVTMLTDNIKQEIKELRSDINDLKTSAQFSAKEIEDLQVKVEFLEGSCSKVEDITRKQIYLENQSRRNNLKILGMEEKSPSESWSETEELVKEKIKDLLDIKEELVIERAHRVQRSSPSSTARGHGRSRDDNDPKPIVARFLNWKQKEMVLRKAREVRPDGVRFVQDFAAETLQRRKEQIPKMLEARQMGKIAFFIGDRLVIKHKPPDRVSADDSQISFNLNDGT